MNEITPNTPRVLNNGRISAPASPDAGRLAGSPAPASPSRSDAVELSDRARLLSKLAEAPEIRSELVDRVKASIASGGYLTADKLESAADNLIDEIDLLG